MRAWACGWCRCSSRLLDVRCVGLSGFSEARFSVSCSSPARISQACSLPAVQRGGENWQFGPHSARDEHDCSGNSRLKISYCPWPGGLAGCCSLMRASMRCSRWYQRTCRARMESRSMERFSLSLSVYVFSPAWCSACCPLSKSRGRIRKQA